MTFQDEFFKTKLLLKFFKSSFILFGNQITIMLPPFLTTYFIGQLSDANAINTFGLTRTFQSLFFISIILGAQEHLGTQCAYYFGQKKINKLNRLYWKGLYYGFTVSIIYAIFAFNSYQILTLVFIKPRVAYITSQLIKKTIPFAFLHSFNNLTQNFLSAQKITHFFFKMNLVSVIVVFIFAKLFIITLDFKQTGFVIAVTMQEICNSFFYIYHMKKILNFKFIPIFDKDMKILKYFYESLKTCGSFYGSVIGYEVNTYFAALYDDPYQLSQFIISSNSIQFIFFINIAFSFHLRNTINRQIGQNKFQKAYDKSAVFITYIFIYAILEFIVILSIRHQIANFLTNDSRLQYLVAINIFYFMFDGVMCVSMYSVNSLMRIVNQNTLQTWLNTLAYPCIVIMLNFILGFWLDFKVNGFIMSLGLSKVITQSIMIYVIFTTNWLSLKPQKKDSTEIEIDIQSIEEPLVELEQKTNKQQNNFKQF